MKAQCDVCERWVEEKELVNGMCSECTARETDD